jgi:hypothetical protein
MREHGKSLFIPNMKRGAARYIRAGPMGPSCASMIERQIESPIPIRCNSLRMAVVYRGKANDLLLMQLGDHEIWTVVAASGAGHELPQQCIDEGNFG